MMNIQEPEGLGVDEDASLGDYPIDTVLIRNENRTIHDVLRRIDKGNFIMDPDFQRDFVWTEDKQSKLIESVLMRIPLPVFYLAENNEGKMIVVDGLQRLSTFQRYVSNKFKLKLPKQKELNDKLFSELSSKLQNRIEDCNLILYSIDAKVPAKALLDIFDRVNSGEPLTRQQMRNCLYTGAATKFLRDEAKQSLFINATGESLDAGRMRDREFINRFCAFQILGISKYKGDMHEFLANALEEMNKMSPEKLEALSLQLRNSLRNNLLVFGHQAFRKHDAEQEKRSVINASLWDVMSIGLADYSETLVESRKEKLKTAFYALLNDKEFLDSITLGTSQANRVKDRFTKAEVLFKEVFNDQAD